jgi:hypothetical protein
LYISRLLKISRKRKLKINAYKKNKKNNDATEVQTQANRVVMQRPTTDLLSPCIKIHKKTKNAYKKKIAVKGVQTQANSLAIPTTDNLKLFGFLCMPSVTNIMTNITGQLLLV